MALVESKRTKQRGSNNVVKTIAVQIASVESASITMRLYSCSLLDFLTRSSSAARPSLRDQYALRLMARDVGEGLSFLHNDCKVVHLDIAARNVLVDHSETLVLGDFGTSTRVGSKTSVPRTLDARISAPEVLRPSGRHPNITGKEDIFSMGRLVEEMHRLAGLKLLASRAEQVQHTHTHTRFCPSLSSSLCRRSLVDARDVFHKHPWRQPGISYTRAFNKNFPSGSYDESCGSYDESCGSFC